MGTEIEMNERRTRRETLLIVGGGLRSFVLLLGSSGSSREFSSLPLEELVLKRDEKD